MFWIQFSDTVTANKPFIDHSRVSLPILKQRATCWGKRKEKDLGLDGFRVTIKTLSGTSRSLASSPLPFSTALQMPCSFRFPLSFPHCCLSLFSFLDPCVTIQEIIMTVPWARTSPALGNQQKSWLWIFVEGAGSNFTESPLSCKFFNSQLASAARAVQGLESRGCLRRGWGGL